MAGRVPAVEEAAPLLRWSVRVDGPLPGALNMARDHALAAALAPGVAALRLYGWSGPTLSLGRNEPALGAYDPRALEAAGVDVVRRPTGGRSVLHHREVTYAVVLPARALGGPRSAYRRVNEAIVRGLSLLGVDAEIARGGLVPPLAAGPCFDAPAPGEVVAAGRKLVGSAQARIGSALLQHGSILLEDDQERVAALKLGRGPAGAAPATLAALLGEAPAPGRVVRAVLAGFRAAFPGAFTDDTSHPAPEGEGELAERYRSRAWTWRR